MMICNLLRELSLLTNCKASHCAMQLSMAHDLQIFLYTKPAFMVAASHVQVIVRLWGHELLLCCHQQG